MKTKESWDDDWPEEDWDEDDDGESYTVPCPDCGADVYEESEQCPVCGNYIVHSTSVWNGRPVWWIVIGILGILAVIFALIPS